MAVEQLRGKPATRQTDIYAVAVVLWEALTGKRLFQEDNDAALMQQVLEGASHAPSALVPSIPPALDALVMRGLDRDPGRRFATAREMAAVLEAIVPLAIPVQVGEWVESTAGPAIASQAARVAEIESASDASVFAAQEATRSAEASAPPPPAPRPRAPLPAVALAPPPPAADQVAEFLSDRTLVAEHPPVADPPAAAPPLAEPHVADATVAEVAVAARAEAEAPGGDATVESGAASQMSSISVSASELPEAYDRRKTTRLVVGGVLAACALIGLMAVVVRAGRRESSTDAVAGYTQSPPAPVASPVPPVAPIAAGASAAPLPAPRPEAPPGSPSAVSAPVAASESANSPPVPATATRRPSPPTPQPQRPAAASPPPQPAAPAPPRPAPSSRPKSGILFSNPG
jgi:serine/threonine-protein kinase